MTDDRRVPVDLAGPDLQQGKVSQSGQADVRYRTGWKGRWVGELTDLVARTLPECRVRYAF